MTNATNPTATTQNIARDLDESAVRNFVLHHELAGKCLSEITVRGISLNTGIPSHRVTPHWEAIVAEKLRALKPGRFA